MELSNGRYDIGSEPLLTDALFFLIFWVGGRLNRPGFRGGSLI